MPPIPPYSTGSMTWLIEYILESGRGQNLGIG